jgi:iron complex outermembrane receptor protein
MQQDAEFVGAEAELSFSFTENLTASVFGDYVRAELASGGNLPRISPRRIGGRLNAALGVTDLMLEYYHVSTQDEIASYERATPGYNMVNATLSFTPFSNANAEIFVRGSNLLNDEVWNHTSFLANTVPLPGRNLSAGFRYTF